MQQMEGTAFLRQLRQIVVAQCPSQQCDADLVRLFINERDEISFATLVRRHGPMVLGVCQNVLHHRQDAEDVFQATFLLLARKAETIRKHQSLSSWLHGVAYRLSHKLRSQNGRRQQRELGAAPAPSSDAGEAMTVRELRLILHEELNRLPEKYRAPLLLCYWEGQTRDEAAHRLGVTGNALKKRLERARSLLGSRLTQRGVVPTVALLTWLISENGARAAVSQILVQTTTQAAAAFATAQVSAAASPAAIALAQGAIRTMLITKCFTTLLTLLAVIGVGAALSFVGYQAFADKPREDEAVALQAQAKPKASTQKTDAERIVGTWVFTKFVANGKEMGADFHSIARFTFSKDGEMTMNVLEQSKSGTYKLSAPGKIDTKEPPSFGIYQFDGDDKLSICLIENKTAEDRPTEFKAGPHIVLFTLRRAKPGEEKVAAADAEKNKGAIQQLREGAQRAVSANNFKQIAIAMHNYHAAYKAFPANAIYSNDGKTALLSWRVAILPFIEQERLYQEFKLNEPWDSAHNKKLIAKMPKIYADVKADAKNEGKTFYQVFTGTGTAFDGNKNKAATDFPAGLSNTAFAIEAKDAVIWTQPTDLPIPAAKGKMPEVGGLFQAGYNVMFGDGSVRFMPRETTPAALRGIAVPKE